MKPEDVCWEYFGFPDPGFMPAWKPAEGLVKALAERKLPFVEPQIIDGIAIRYKWESDSIYEENQIKLFDPLPNGQLWCIEFDRQLKSLSERYLNHLKLDLSDLTYLSDTGFMWTWEDLLLEAADGEESDIAYPEKGDLSPEWNLKWLIQRQKAINLLLYAPIPYLYDYISGSTHTGEPSSPAESVAAAIAGMIPGQGSGLPSSYVHNIYGPDHGWDEGSYCCDVAVTTRIYADLPEGFDPDGNVYLIIKVTGADGSDESFAGGGELSVGLNILTAGQNGVFVEFPETDLADMAGTPTKDHETSGGWMATQCRAYADYTSKFHFKGD